MSTVTKNQLGNKSSLILLDYINRKRMKGEFNDVTIRVGKDCIPANRVVLSCFSKFFESMFLSSFKERNKKFVVIEEFDSESVRSLIDYIYTTTININLDNALDLLSTADFLQIEDAKNLCFDFLESALSVENCFEVYIGSILYNNSVLTDKSVQFISKNFESLSQSNAFKGLAKNI